MKRLLLILKVLLPLLMVPCYLYAYDFEVDGIYYRIDKKSNSVGVEYGDVLYQGVVVIPSEVLYNGKNYTVSSIRSRAFSGCSSLNSITIPISVTIIHDKAFEGCSSLTSITIPNSVTFIGDEAFSGCSSLTDFTIPNSVTTINSYTFKDCIGLTSINIPNSVTSIGCGPFYGCTCLTNITIPKSVTTIDSYAFNNCSGLTSITIPNSVSSIGEAITEGCSGLFSIKVEDGNIMYDSRENCNAIIETSSNTLLAGCKNTIIPNSVTSIGRSAFGWCYALTNITLPNSVTSIGKSAFHTCIGLSGINIPNSVTSIGEEAFYECSSLSNITLPNSIISIDKNAFAFSGLTSITIPSSMKTIGSNAFAFCDKLTNITIPNSVNTIESYAFGWCSNLTDIVIPSSVTSIGAAFYCCYDLMSVTIPNSVTWIGGDAFKNCKKLNSVISLIEKPFPIDDSSFDNISSSSVLQVPKGTKELYQQTEGWSNHFSSIEEISIAEVYTLYIKPTGNGFVSYGTTNIKNETKSFQLEEGNSATITICPDNGYRIKSVKVNSVDVTSSVSNNSYTVSNIKANTTVEVEFEAIPIPTYTLSVKATGNGSAAYNGTTAKNNTQSFTLNEGTSATITFAPDNGYRIKSVKVNSADVTSSVSNNSYTVSNIKANTTIEVEFEAIPIPTYTLSVKATGNGSATYSGTTAKNNTQTITLNEGTTATIAFTPDNGYRIKSVKLNSADVTSSVSNSSYTVNNIKANTTVEVEFEAIPIPTYTLYVKASGNGSATFNNTTAKNDSKTFTLNEGTSATIAFTPDSGYRIKSVKVNSVDVTSGVSNNSYTVSNIKANTTVEVEFEVIPINSYTLKYVVDGVTYQTYQIQEGATITPEAMPTKEGYTFSGWSEIPQIMPSMDVTVTGSFIVNKYKLTYQVDGVEYKSYDVEYGATITPETFPTKDGYTFSGWSEIPKTMPAKDVTVVGTFTKDEPVIMSYTLAITASGNGSATFNNTTAKNDSKTFTLNEGTSATIAFTPDSGYRIKSVKVNSVDVTSSVSNNSYNVSDIKANTTVEVEFEAIPVNTYVITYVVDGETYKTYEIEEGAVITPEAEPSKDGYTFSGWSEIPATMPANDVTITGTFTKMDSRMTIDGINYETVPFSEHLVVVAEGDYGSVLEVPETITYGNETWTVMGLKDGALDQCENLAAVIWEPSTVFNARVSNPNLLLYVKDKSYASFGVNNVIVNGTAESIELTDASSGNDFYCPKAFKAKKISYSHRYNMETGLGDSKGWETIVLPFDVQKCTSPKGEIVPFTKWSESDKTKPFWLFELTASGYKDVAGIKANTPYIISMPNNPQYLADYVIIGLVTFSAENAEVKASEDMLSAKYQDRTFVPNYTNKTGDNYLALNVNSYYVTNPSTDIDGSKFIKGLRAVHPFEAYMTTTSNTRSIDVMDGMTTAIRNIMMTAESKDVIKVYDTKGVLVKTAKVNDDLRKGLAAGVYIVNGKKMIIK